MRKLLRYVLSFSAIAVVLIGVVHVQPSWASNVSIEWWSLCDLERTIEEQLRLTVELEAQQEQADRRAQTRRHIVAEVVADRMTLIEAAAEFRRLNQTLPSRILAYQNAYSGKSEGEQLCRYVIRL